MLLFLSSMILSQNTDTKNLSNITDVYNGLQQNGYLKNRLRKTEVTLKSANELISEQEKQISVNESLIASKNKIIATKDEVLKQEITASNERENQLKTDISYLQADYKILQETSKIKQRKRFWNGVKIGGVSVAVIGVAGLLLIK